MIDFVFNFMIVLLKIKMCLPYTFCVLKLNVRSSSSDFWMRCTYSATWLGCVCLRAIVFDIVRVCASVCHIVIGCVCVCVCVCVYIFTLEGRCNSAVLKTGCALSQSLVRRQLLILVSHNPVLRSSIQAQMFLSLQFVTNSVCVRVCVCVCVVLLHWACSCKLNLLAKFHDSIKRIVCNRILGSSFSSVSVQ